MTLAEFYHALSQNLEDDPQAEPGYTSQGMMRLSQPDGWYPYCPITYLALRLEHRRFDTVDVLEAGAVLGLRPRTTRRIVKAADNLSQSQTRQRLETLWRKSKEPMALKSALETVMSAAEKETTDAPAD